MARSFGRDPRDARVGVTTAPDNLFGTARCDVYPRSPLTTTIADPNGVVVFTSTVNSSTPWSGGGYDEETRVRRSYAVASLIARERAGAASCGRLGKRGVPEGCQTTARSELLWLPRTRRAAVRAQAGSAA